MLSCFPAPAPYVAGTMRCEGEKVSLSVPASSDGATWLSQDWGDVPTWCAVVAAVAAAIYAARAYRLERGRDVAAERIQIQSQANNVAFWMTEVDNRYSIHYYNGTNQVVEDVVFEIVDLGNGESLDGSLVHGTLPPGDSDSTLTGVSLYPDPVALRTTFRDAQGISWARFNGKLEPERGAEQPSWWKSLSVDWDRLLMSPLPALTLVLAEVTRDVGQLMAAAGKLGGVSLLEAAKLLASYLSSILGFAGHMISRAGRAIRDLFRRR